MTNNTKVTRPRRARRTRTGHSGVKLQRRSRQGARTIWIARWTDPDTGRIKQVSLAALGLSSHEARREWAVLKSQAIQQRRADLRSGAPRHSGLTLVGAVEHYFAVKKLATATTENYRGATVLFVAWANSVGLAGVDSVFPHHLERFKDHLVGMKRRVPVQGGRRSQRQPGLVSVEPATVNNRLRALKAVLNKLRRLGHLPHVSSEDLRDRFKPVRVNRSRPDFLRQGKIRALLTACIEHDKTTFTQTRSEHAGKAPSGMTPRYVPISPFVVFVLLTGCRLGEARQLAWRTVHLNAQDENGAKTGEIVLAATATKTRHERAVDLAVSPALRALIAAMAKRRNGPFVFGDSNPWSRSRVDTARKRLLANGRLDPFTWQNLRQTCSTFLTNAPGIFGAASAYRSARQLGHSVAIAEKHYLGLVRIPRDAKTLEAAMGIDDLLDEVIQRLG
jgi:integrase